MRPNKYYDATADGLSLLDIGHNVGDFLYHNHPQFAHTHNKNRM